MHSNQTKTLPSLSFEFPPRVMIVEARFYEDVADALVQGAMAVLNHYGARVSRFAVPGALEIPAAVEMGVRAQRFDAYVTLGCVIRGETSHYDISVKHVLCLGNGILTVENKAQAMARANPSDQDKGGGAAMAALSMLSFKNTLAGRG
jgi:6,7-dimethyl-8-ribityllumazine synthase